MILNQPFKNSNRTNGSRFTTSIRKLCLKYPNFIDFYQRNDHILYFVRLIFLLTIHKKFLNQQLIIKSKKNWKYEYENSIIFTKSRVIFKNSFFLISNVSLFKLKSMLKFPSFSCWNEFKSANISSLWVFFIDFDVF